ncbi:hypothetical protein B0A48_01193 [Cryoendolithus antarcticus]|uniref:LicD/FKTN/FKRP nucleotidyltransferase domain-containing protein n=1 Tax=Cryoendolithus antarcticus TaxID=1507870 RepID=A0A1V8TSM2_9PEZI|nr:hypothetical protein B0A48_01193 [Cryoendolithus antarcticus]
MRSRYAWLLVGLACQDLANALAVPSSQGRDESVKPPHHRVKPQTVQLVSPNQNAPGKYFHEASFSGHYDGRFASGKLPYDARREHLTALTHTYFKTMNDIGIETWLMHGSLLGWYWNRNALPWDSDIDVMVSERSIDHLANYYNMSMHHYAEPGREAGRDYLLEINPHYHVDSTSDTTNVIDARWICTQTGLFIDITTLRQNRSAQAQGIDGAMMVKDNHHYMYDDIFPLRETTFEGVNTRVPFAYADLLVEEYGPAALSKTTHENHRWDTEKQEWIPLSCLDFRTCDDFHNHLQLGTNAAEMAEHMPAQPAAAGAGVVAGADGHHAWGPARPKKVDVHEPSRPARPAGESRPPSAHVYGEAATKSTHGSP